MDENSVNIEIRLEALQATPEEFRHPTHTRPPSDSLEGQERACVYASGKTCRLPSCEKPVFQNRTGQQKDFCSPAHKEEYHRLAHQIGDRVLRGELTVSGKSQTQSVLAMLEGSNRWMNLKMLLPFVTVRDPVAKLRKRGYDIRVRRVWSDTLRKTEYQYRLVKKERE